jgi:hypothetical protein
MKGRIPKFSGMNGLRAPTLLLAVLVAAGLGSFANPRPAVAGCTEPPGPGVNWQRCTFDGLKEAYRAKFVNAGLQGAVFDGAKLYEADLTKADLTGASLVGVDLRRARLYRAVLRDANLTSAQLKGADLTRADLSGATWTDGERVCAEGSVGRCN